MLVLGQEKRFIENMVDGLDYPQDWQLKERLRFIHVSPRIEQGNHRKTNKMVIFQCFQSSEKEMRCPG